VRWLQDHVALEAEVARLRDLLLDVWGRIDAKVGVSPFQRSASLH
jgi:hypothetical protein